MFVLILFILAVILCVSLGYSVAYALLLGYALLFLHGRKSGHSSQALLSLSAKGIRSVKNVFINYLLVGMLTALWRACGTIPVLTYYSIDLLQPRFFALTAFLLCAVFSTLTGTAFGSVSTIGIICMTIGNSIGADPLVLGGAILSGVRFGDRCSPVSTSALLICEMTKTNIYHNVKNMARTSALPFLIACVFYLCFGRTVSVQADLESVRQLISAHFSLSWVSVLPALLVIVMMLCRVPIRKLFLWDLLLSAAVAWAVEGTPLSTLPVLLLRGFHPADAELSALFGGGGIVSVSSTLVIVLISSTYIELLKVGDLLSALKQRIMKASPRIGGYGVVLLVSSLIALVSCNQTLTIILTAQLCKELLPSSSHLASSLADSASVIPALIPWSVACALPLAVIGAPTTSVLFAVYIYLLPLCHSITERYVHKYE